MLNEMLRVDKSGLSSWGKPGLTREDQGQGSIFLSCVGFGGQGICGSVAN